MGRKWVLKKEPKRKGKGKGIRKEIMREEEKEMLDIKIKKEWVGDCSLGSGMPQIKAINRKRTESREHVEARKRKEEGDRKSRNDVEVTRKWRAGKMKRKAGKMEWRRLGISREL